MTKIAKQFKHKSSIENILNFPRCHIALNRHRLLKLVPNVRIQVQKFDIKAAFRFTVSTKNLWRMLCIDFQYWQWISKRSPSFSVKQRAPSPCANTQWNTVLSSSAHSVRLVKYTIRF